MKKSVFIPLLLALIVGYTLYSCKPVIHDAPEKIIGQMLVAQVDSMVICKNKLLAAAESGKADEKQPGQPVTAREQKEQEKALKKAKKNKGN